ncbi:Outer membrane receptor proteins, mostly Fe transport [Soonwooa buanensis]|uniref:Outer membrane receptor proteins, mostly Fe transport n=1 Tax=Soonwooa buanensis TaxID=619805 RepID=A0A1T5ECW0_9FLAO|nr:outer membrane beta-barrel family protein [Soonwooa buanensis]SKB81743.1 Outer membrane receptor proteins, mostly Fe transport [Soonwooa buanensis]
MKTPILIAALFFSGFATAQQKTNDTIKSQNTKEIEAVTITKQVFKKQSDRFVYDVAASPVAKGNTTFDLLKQTPLLSTTDDKTLKIAGKNNAIVYINGRKSNMDAESLTSFLKNTPAENIQKIEVITLPGSEYQVEASDGIINIVLKKKMTDGLNGNFRMSNTQNKYNSTSSSASLNYRKGKFGLNANITGSQEIEPQEYIIRNGNKNTITESVGPIDSPEKNLGGYINMDYQLTDKSNLALSWNTWASNSKGATILLNNTYSNYDDNGNLTNRFYNLSRNVLNNRSYNNNFNLNYELKTDEEGSKLNLNAAYLTYKRIQDSDNRTYASDANWNQGALANQIIQDTPQNINNISAMADYIKKFKNDFTVSIGGNYNKTKTENDTKYESTNFAANEATKYKPNLFEYDENIYGFYLTLEKKFSDKFSGKIGTRYEITNSIGTSDNPPAERPDMARVEKNYNNILPYLSLNYAINDKNNISYAFSSRMRRPSFWELNPVRNIITQDNYTQNNPFVKSSSIYNQELTYMFKNSYFLILNHSYFKDVITMVPLQRDVVRDGNTYRQLAYIRSNYGDKQEMSAMLGMQKSFFNQYLTTNFNIGLQHNINNGTLNSDPTTGEIFDTYTNTKKSTSLIIQTNNTIRLDKAKTWFAGVNFFYVDKQQIDFGQLQSLAGLDLSIKKLWNNWTFAVNVNDVLRTNIVKIKDEQADGNFNYLSNDTFRRGLTASVTYNFGNQKVQKARKVDGAADDIKSRTR